MFFFASVVQAGIVALGLLGASPQLPRIGAASRFPVSVIRVLAVEGGYVEHRVDPGGATKHGVTRARLAQHRGRPVTKAEVRGLTIAEAVAIYRTLYWDALAADELPPGVDHALFDFAVHSGVPRAARALQRALGVADDGRIGRATIAAAREADATLMLGRLCAERRAFMSGLSTWRTFGRGWSARMNAVEACGPAHAAVQTAAAGSPGGETRR